MVIGVLGATGFVGQNLIQRLQNDNIPYKATSRKIGIDVTNTSHLISWLEHYNITHLINLAAECGGIGLNMKRPADLWIASTKISASVIEAVISTNITKLIQVGTVCSYAKNSPVPFKEADLMWHGEPEYTNLAYGIAKLNSLYGAQAATKQYGINILSFLPVNMFGPHDHFDLINSHVIPALIRKVENAKLNNDPHITSWGSGKATREFLYVEDFVDAIMLGLEHGNTPAFINIGTGIETPISSLVEIIANIMGYTGEIRWDLTMPDGQPRRCLDVSRAKELLGFTAKTSLTVGLQKTIDWYKREKPL